MTERLVIAAITALALGVRLAYGEHIRDDAYITLRYAAHLAAGLGFTYDTGQHVLGTTTPLYTLLLALLAGVGLPIDLAATGVGITSDVVAVLVLWTFGRSVIGRRAALFACLLYALMAPLVAYAVSGMETPLYLLLILVAFLLAERGRELWTAVACALLVLLRPDGALVPVALLASRVWSFDRATRFGAHRFASARRFVRDHSRPVGLFLVLTMPWLLFAWRYFGSPVPESMIAKFDLPGTTLLVSFRSFASYFLDLGERWFLPLTIVAVLSAVLGLRDCVALRPLFIWSALYTSAFLLSNKFVYPLWPFEWYFLPLLIPLALSAGWGLARLAGLIRRPAGTQLLLVVLTIAGLIHLRQEYLLLDRNVAGRETLYIRIAGILNRYGATNDMVAAAEIGALGSAHPGPLLDLAGLVSPTALGMPTLGVLETQHPAWLVIWNTNDDARTLGASPWFDQHYRQVTSIENWESRRLLLFRWYPSPQPERDNGPVLDTTYDLVGRSLSWQQSSQGFLLHVQLTWKALRMPTNPASFSLQLVGADGSKLAQQDNVPQEGSRPVTTWRKGDLMLDRYDLQLPGPAVAKLSALVIGGYAFGNPEDRLGWQSPGGTAIGSRLYVPVPPPVGPDPTPNATACVAQFAGGLQLAGYSYHVIPGGVSLLLRWAEQHPVARDYTVFVHALDASGRTIGQADAPPFDGLMLTSTWFPGDVINDVHILKLSTNALDRLDVGLYDPGTMGRLHRRDADKDDVILPTSPSLSCH